MGIEKIVNIQKRINDLIYTIDALSFLGEDYSAYLNKLRMQTFDLQKETEKLLAQSEWAGRIAIQAQNQIPTYKKVITNAGNR
jgi:hypothetical protein